MNTKLKTALAAGVIAVGVGVAAIATSSSAQTSSGSIIGTTGIGIGGSSNGGSANSAQRAALFAALAPLIANGTISQAQAEAVVTALAGADLSGSTGTTTTTLPGTVNIGPLSATDEAFVAFLVGLSVDELRAQRNAGVTIAALAVTAGVLPQTIIDQLVLRALSANPGADRNAVVAAITHLVNGTTPPPPTTRGGPSIIVSSH